ncbi:putative transcription factor interactor and regulator C3H-WRC/GRF family [Helianthus annuus]|nr:putative transcription factor interactor and regulator C3H-WRC/GRF family [Helianthus annuus]
MRDQKYCERHAHKNRPRSRKPVETQSLNTKNLNNKDNYHSLLPPTPSMPTSCQQSRWVFLVLAFISLACIIMVVFIVLCEC